MELAEIFNGIGANIIPDGQAANSSRIAAIDGATPVVSAEGRGAEATQENVEEEGEDKEDEKISK